MSSAPRFLVIPSLCLILLLASRILFAGEIEIQGSTPFITRTKAALERLQGSASFASVKPFVAVIKESKSSGMRAYELKPTYEVGKPTWQHSVTWYAGSIVHDGCHSKLYHDAKKRLKKEPDPGAWTGKEAEIACLKLQLRALTEIKADAYPINYVKNLLKGSPTYQGDPLSWSEYERRKY